MNLTITAAATEHIAKCLSGQAKSVGVRLGIRTTGCSGFAYTVDYATAFNDDDVKIPCNDFFVLVGEDHINYLDGLELDYLKVGVNSGFQFNNPNEKARCGCGESFSV